MAEKLWANSGDSHFVEPPDLFEKNLPKDLAERMPKSVKDPDGEYETVTVDGQSFRRKMPKRDGQGGRYSLPPRSSSTRSASRVAISPGVRPATAGTSRLDWRTLTARVSGVSWFSRPSGSGRSTFATRSWRWPGPG